MTPSLQFVPRAENGRGGIGLRGEGWGVCRQGAGDLGADRRDGSAFFMCFSIAVAAVIAAAAWSALALARSVWMWPVAGAWVAAGAGALDPDVAAGWRVGGGWRWRARSGRGY